MPRNQLAGYYGGGQTIGGGLASLGQNIGGAMMTRKERKRQEEAMRQLASLLYGDKDVPNISDPAKAMGGLLSRGAGLPMVGPLAAMQAAGMNEMVAPAGKAAEERARAGNEQNAMMRGLMTQGGEAGQALALQEAQRRMAPSKDRPEIVPVTDGAYVLDRETGEYVFHPTKQRESKVQTFSPGNTYRVIHPSGEIEQFTIPKNPEMDYKEFVNEGLTKRYGTQVKELWQKPKGSGEWQNTGHVTSYGMTTQVTSQMAPWQKDTLLKKFAEQATQASDAEGRLAQVSDTFKPEYMTYWAKAGGTIAEILDKAQLPGVEFLPSSVKEWLGNKAAFEQNVNSNVNLYIKEITGAQMSYQEVGRLMLAIANLNDSPAVFASKLKNGLATLEAAKQKKLAILSAYAGTGADPSWVLEQAEKAAADYLRGQYPEDDEKTGVPFGFTAEIE